MSSQDFKFSRADFVSPPIGVVPNYDSDDDSPSSESSDESDPEETNGESREEHSARERERQRVLKAAGLVVTADAAPPPKRKRRPAPAAPKRSSVASSINSKDLPPVPEANSTDAGLGVEDAFDRYEAFKQSHGNVNRMSVASVDTGSSSPVSPPHGGSMSKEGGESRGYTSFLHFLRTSGDSEKRSVPTISAPMSISPTPSSRAQSPGFGTVSVYFCADI
jgi:actin cytoskeleton-regulatory complex protein PAN1